METFLEEEESSGTGFDLTQLWRMFWRRKWLFIVPFILCSAMAAFTIRVMTPIYYSSGQIHVIFQNTAASVVPREVDRYTSYRARDTAHMIYSTIETIVTDPLFLDKTARTAMQRHPGLVDAARAQLVEAGVQEITEQKIVSFLVGRLNQNVKVEYDGTNLYRIGVRHTDPNIAFIMAKLVVDLFLEEEQASRVLPATTARDFLQTQLATWQNTLREAEQQYAAYQSTILTESLAGNPVSELNLTQVESNLQQLRSDYQQSAIELSDHEGFVRPILGSLPDLTAIVRDPEIMSSMRELVELEGEYATVRGTTDEADIENELGETRISLNSELEIRARRNYPQLGILDQNRITQYYYYRLYHDIDRQVIERLEEHIRQFRSFRARQPEQSAELSRLQRDVQAARDMVSSIRSDISRENMRLEASMSEIGYKIVVRRQPLLPQFPVEPDKKKLYFMGVVLALAMGGGLVVLAIFLDRSFQSVKQIEDTLKLKVIGTLPMIENDYFQKQKRRRYWIWIVLVVIILAIAAVGMFVVYPRFT